MSKISVQKAIDLLRSGDNKILEKIYLENRESFINFSRKYNVSQEEAVDIYQDAILVFRDNVIEGKIDGLDSNISTYLFAIGKYKIYHNFRQRSKTEHKADFDNVEESVELDVNFLTEELTNEQKLLQTCFEKLGRRCQSVLRLFYYEGYTLDEIKDILKYSDKKVLKSQKSRCLRHLRDLVNKENGTSGSD